MPTPVTMLSFVSPTKAAFLVAMLIISTSVGGAFAETVTLHLKNNCPFTIWATWTRLCSEEKCDNKCPTASELGHGQKYTIYPPLGWNGNVFARTGCTPSSIDLDALTCDTADCSGKFSCDATTPTRPYTHASFRPVSNTVQQYSVSTLEGFNIPMVMAADVPSGTGCHRVGCECDAIPKCPKELRRENKFEVIGCKNPCSPEQPIHWRPACCNNGTSSIKGCPFGHLMDTYCSLTEILPHTGSHIQSCNSPSYTVTFCPGAGLANAKNNALAA